MPKGNLDPNLKTFLILIYQNDQCCDHGLQHGERVVTETIYKYTMDEAKQYVRELTILKSPIAEKVYIIQLDEFLMTNAKNFLNAKELKMNTPEFIMKKGLKLNLIDIYDKDGKSTLLRFLNFSKAIKVVKEWYAIDKPYSAYEVINKDGLKLLYVNNMNQNDFTHI